MRFVIPHPGITGWPTNGRCVAYQESGRVAGLGGDFLGPGRIATELLNIPPMRTFQWEEPTA